MGGVLGWCGHTDLDSSVMNSSPDEFSARSRRPVNRCRAPNVYPCTIVTVTSSGRAVLRDAEDPLAAARAVLGGLLTVGAVQARIVEVEAYGGDPSGPWPIRRRTPSAGRLPGTRSCSGPPGHLYVYRSYGMHFCANVTYGPDGVAGECCCGPRKSSKDTSSWPRGVPPSDVPSTRHAVPETWARRWG